MQVITEKFSLVKSRFHGTIKVFSEDDVILIAQPPRLFLSRDKNFMTHNSKISLKVLLELGH